MKCNKLISPKTSQQAKDNDNDSQLEIYDLIGLSSRSSFQRLISPANTKKQVDLSNSMISTLAAFTRLLPKHLQLSSAEIQAFGMKNYVIGLFSRLSGSKSRFTKNYPKNKRVCITLIDTDPCRCKNHLKLKFHLRSEFQLKTKLKPYSGRYRRMSSKNTWPEPPPACGLVLLPKPRVNEFTLTRFTP